MASHQAYIKAYNDTSAHCCIRLYHYNSDYGIESGSFYVVPNSESTNAMTVHFNTGLGSLTVEDYWWASLSPVNQPTDVSWYSSLEDPSDPKLWHENQLQSEDADATMVFNFAESGYTVNLNSGSETKKWLKIGGKMQNSGYNFTNVFVLMLENRSFDNIFAFSGIRGITLANDSSSNTYTVNGKPQTVYASNAAPSCMPTDPGHEFLDVVEQLGGEGATYTVGEYQLAGTTNQTGYAANYATSQTEKTGLPTAAQVQDVMACFDTQSKLPVIYTLATEFALCYNWYSSMPGPTWPNRYFVHGASSAGLDDSPTDGEMVEWFDGGFSYPNGSLYDKLDSLNILYLDNFGDLRRNRNWRIYQDANGSLLGAIPQVTSISGLETTDANSLDDFASDLQQPYPYRYTFIEPNYGNMFNHTYSGGTSQHPMDGMAGGEGLIKRVYEAIRNSPLWEGSLLIITYDEHGGLFDSYIPAAYCVPPGDNPQNDNNKHGFNFAQLGVRVPAIVISPFTAKGEKWSNVCEHSAVVKTVTSWLGLGDLTNRDKHSPSLNQLAQSPLRTDCPTTLPIPVPDDSTTNEIKTSDVSSDALLSASGNHWGFLHVLAKSEFEHSAKTPEDAARIKAHLQTIKTVGQAEEYARSVLEHARQVRAARKAAGQQVARHKNP